MANLKELRGRITSVGKTAQITRAMEMVASIKLRRVQAKAFSFQDYATEVRTMMERLAGKVGSESGLEWFREDRGQTTGVLLITSDRGLCGSYNANVFKALQARSEEVKEAAAGQKVKFYVYGRKGYTWLVRRGFQVERFFVDPPLDKLDFTAARIVADALSQAFLKREIDRVRIVHTKMASVSRFEPINERLLPIVSAGAAPVVPGSGVLMPQAPEAALDMLMEPDAKQLLDIAVPKYLETIVYNALLQSLASEMASRRMAMKSATDAANRMAKTLKKRYNRARQESITKELLDIVGGASAVK